MKSNPWRIGLALALLGPAMLAAGCTGTEVLEPRTSDHLLEVKLVDVPTKGWTRYSDDPQEWVGYERLSVDTDVLGLAPVPSIIRRLHRLTASE